MPLLKELIFSGSAVGYLGNYDFFHDAPNLRRVTLGDQGRSSIPMIRLPWAQLTTYKATYDRKTHLRILSAAAKTLVECDLGFPPRDFFGPMDGFDTDTLNLPHLRRLITSRAAFLRCLAAPALEELHVDGPIDQVLPFLCNSTCVLTRLTLFMCGALAEDIVLLLRTSPALTTLAIDLIPSASTEINLLITALTICPGAEPLCPHLTSLSWGDRNNTIDLQAFLEMVESRWRSGC
jgi:hypothetical protein